MLKNKVFISLVLLGLLLFPMVEKAVHELSHDEDDHCESTEAHYCAIEHNCTICDYVFSSTTTPPNSHSEVVNVHHRDTDSNFDLSTKALINRAYTFSLRGPPYC